MAMKESPLSKVKISFLIVILIFSTIAFPANTENSPNTVETNTVGSSEEIEFPYPGDDWAWNMIGTEYAHQKGVTGEDVVIAVLDTGIDYNHPDLEDRMWEDIGHDFVDDGEPMDKDGHGTHAAGIISSVAPDAELMALRVIDEEDEEWVDLSEPVEFARENGADIITMSFAGKEGAFTPEFKREVDEAHDQDDIVNVAAAGNEDTDEEYYPAAYDSVIGVSALDSDMSKAYYSNYGDWIDLAGPGGGREDQIFSTLPGDDYGEMIGTSMACPFVAGSAALRMNAEPEESNEEIKDHLMNTSISLETDEYLGSGLVNAYRAAGGQVPTPIMNLQIEINVSSVGLSWDEPWDEGASPIKGYRIYRSEYGSELEVIREFEEELFEYEDEDVEENITYQYKVTAFNHHGESLESDLIFATPRKESVVPSSPRDVSLEFSEDGIEVAWSEPIDDGGTMIQRYNLYRRELGEDGEMNMLAGLSPEISNYLDKTVSPESEYEYAVSAENEIGESVKAFSDPFLVPENHQTHPKAISSPRNVSAEVLEESVQISWSIPVEDSDSSITNYNIYRGKFEEQNDLKKIGEVGPGTYEFIDDTASEKTDYYYAVEAENEEGVSIRSRSMMVSTPEGFSSGEIHGFIQNILDRFEDVKISLVLLPLLGTASILILIVGLWEYNDKRSKNR